ncbi:hypothetical protein FZC84_16085 [Rossellomorea vietnamensis]|uniref:Uncharacterized protein n=2 Tax=Bacillales TaxID=1385 RepID=A0A5D4MAZ6_9BACI|nr:hypothetical protein FZC84_16085 [Rossellomorea vietnamensis]
MFLPLVIIFIAIGLSQSSKRRQTGGDASSPFIMGSYSDSNNCDSSGGGFGGGDGGGCGGGE